MEQEVLQYLGNYGVLGLLAYFSMKEFFSYLKSKKENGNEKKEDDKQNKEDARQDIDIAILKEQMQVILTNHLPHIQKSLEDNASEHRETQSMLVRIMTKLDIN